MQLSGEHRIPAPRQAVWQALHDPAILKDCIEGCQRLERQDDRHMTATVVVKLGPVKATFDASIEIVDEVPPQRYTLRGEGKGGVAGFASGSATVNLAEDGAGTILGYTSEAKVGGKLAQLGSRLVDATAKTYAADFFERFAARLAADDPDASWPVGTVEGAASGRIEPRRAEEGVYEIEEAVPGSPVAPPHAEDGLEEKLEIASAQRVWGGAPFWGILAFLAVVLILLALG